MGWGVSVTPRPLSTPGKHPVPIVQEAGWAPGPVWTCVENLALHRDSILHPVASRYTDWATGHTLDISTTSNMHGTNNFLFCVRVKWPLPPGDNPIAVNKYYYYYY
jgi:hypothetical protein